MKLLKKACLRQDLKLAGDDFNHQKVRLYETPWILDVRDPVKNPEHVLAYLATIRQLMRLSEPPNQLMATAEGIIQQPTGNDITVWPCCQKGKMLRFRQIPKRMARPSNPLAYVAA